MKIVLAFLPCWLCYGLGDLVSKLGSIERFEDSERWASIWYPVYNRLMIWSDKVQMWAGGDRWFPWNVT